MRQWWILVGLIVTLSVAIGIGFDLPFPFAATSSPPVATPATAYPLRLGMNLGQGSALYAAAERFAEQVKSQSKGVLTVTIYPDQQLGSDEAMIEMTRSGELDLALIPTAKLTTLVPAMQYADLPFFFDDATELYRMLDGEPGELLLAKVAAVGLVGMAFWENGFKHFTANQPIHTPADLIGKRFRTMKSRLIVEQFHTLGATAVPIDFHTTRQALQDGVVDGQENPLVAITSMRFYEVQSHLTLSSHGWLGYLFAASQSSFEALPQPLRQILLDNARQLTAWERTETQQREAIFLKTIRAAGVKINELTQAERRLFQDHLAPLERKFALSVGYDLLAKTAELRLTDQLRRGERPLLLGVDVDLSMSGALGGAMILRGAELAVEQINQQGGLLGRPLQIIARDHAANGYRGTANFNYFKQLPNLIGVVGGLNNAAIQNEQDLNGALNVPYLVPWASAAPALNPPLSNEFRLSLPDQQVALLLLQHAEAAAGGGRVALLLERSDSGRSIVAALDDELKRSDRLVEWINRGEQNWVPLLQRLVDQQVTAVVMMVGTAEKGHLVDAMAMLPQPLPIWADSRLTSDDFWRNHHKGLNRVSLRFVQSVLLYGVPLDPPLKQLIELYRTRYQIGEEEPILAPMGLIHSYELVQMLAAAVRQVGSMDPVVVRRGLEQLRHYQGVLNHYDAPFSATHHQIDPPLPLRLVRFNERGQMVAAE